jgi:hypothetical protein
MKAWIATVLGGSLLLALWALPPRDESFLYLRVVQRADYPPEVESYRRVLAEARARHDVFQRLVWRDSLASLTRWAREEGPGWAAALPPPAPASLEPRLQAMVGDQLAALGVARPAAVVGAVVMDLAFGAHPGFPGAGSGTWGQVMASSDPANPFCFVVEPVRFLREDSTRVERLRLFVEERARAPGEAPNPLGPCALYAAFGPAGPHVDEWLGEGGYLFGAGDRPEGPEPAPASRVRSDVAPRGLFGRREGYPVDLNLSLFAEACLQGKEEGCRTALFQEVPEAVQRSRGLALRSGVGEVTYFSEWMLGPYWAGMFVGAERRLLWDLAEEFGTDRFRRFWGSERGVEEAFQAAFGEPMTSWVVRWGRRQVRPLADPGAMPWPDVLLTLLAVALLAGLGVAVHGRGR